MTPEETASGLERCREQIDVLDRQIASLLNERAKVVEVIGGLKQGAQMRVYEPKREDQVFANISSANHGPLTNHSVRGIFERIIDEMRSIQRQRMIQTPPEEPKC